MPNAATLLILVPLLPLLGALVCLAAGSRRALACYMAETFILLALAAGTLLVWNQANLAETSGLSFRNTEDLPNFEISLGRLGDRGPKVALNLAIDGLNAWLVFLTLGVGAAVIATSKSWVGEYPGAAMALLLLAVSFTLMAFLSMDMLVFYVFFELTLVPMFLLVGIWGGPDRQIAAQRMFLYTLAGGLCTLLGLLALAVPAGDFNWTVLRNSDFSGEGIFSRPVIFVLLMAGFIVKTPLVPFHTWQAITYVQAPTPVTAFLSAVLAKLGLYGMLRLGVFVMPDEMQTVGAHLLGSFAVASIVYGALCAFGSRDIKSLLAYSSLSHLGYVVLGLVSLDPSGLQGAVFHMVAHGVVTAGLLLAAGMIEAHEQTLVRSDLKGLLSRYPAVGGLFVFFCLASVGVPGLSQFVGEFLCLFGFFKSGVATLLGPVAVFGVMSGLFLGGWYTMTLIQESFSGTPETEETVPVKPRQLVVLGSLAAVVLWLGLSPQFVLETSGPEIKLLEQRHPAPATPVASAVVPGSAPRTIAE